MEDEPNLCGCWVEGGYYDPECLGCRAYMAEEKKLTRYQRLMEHYKGKDTPWFLP